MSMVIKKRQVIISTLVVALAAAVFLNWYFTGSGKDLISAGALDAQKNLGDSQFVNSSTSVPQNGLINPSGQDQTSAPADASPDASNVNDSSSANYFAQAKLTRQQTEDKAKELLEQINNANLSEELKKEAVDAGVKLAEIIKLQSDIETLVMAKGFSNCVVAINNEKAEIVVPGESLDNAQTLQIKEIVLNKTDITAENISIIPVK